MGKLRWYKRDPVAALDGMSNLTLEERGAYNTVLDLIYARDGAVDDDDRFIAGWLRCDIRVWRRIRARLIDLRKLYVAEGMLRNSRADEEVDRGLSMVASASEAGKASARKRDAAHRNNNQLDRTSVASDLPTNSTATTTSRETPSLRSGEPTDVSGKPAASKKSNRGCRLPNDWRPTTDDRASAVALLGEQRAAGEFNKFRDYWRAQPGQRGVKLDWDATWRNWCRKAGEQQGRGPPPRPAASNPRAVAEDLRRRAMGMTDATAPVRPEDPFAATGPVIDGELDLGTDRLRTG